MGALGAAAPGHPKMLSGFVQKPTGFVQALAERTH